MIEHAIKICLNEERKEKDNCHFFFQILLELFEFYRIYLSEFE